MPPDGHETRQGNMVRAASDGTFRIRAEGKAYIVTKGNLEEAQRRLNAFSGSPWFAGSCAGTAGIEDSPLEQAQFRQAAVDKAVVRTARQVQCKNGRGMFYVGRSTSVCCRKPGEV